MKAKIEGLASCGSGLIEVDDPPPSEIVVRPVATARSGSGATEELTLPLLRVHDGVPVYGHAELLT